MVDEVFFNSNVSGQYVCDETVRQVMLLVKQANHLLLLDDQDPGRPHCRGSRHAHRLSGQGSLAKKLAGAQHRDNCLFARFGEYRDFDAPLLNVHDAI